MSRRTALLIALALVVLGPVALVAVLAFSGNGDAAAVLGMLLGFMALMPTIHLIDEIGDDRR